MKRILKIALAITAAISLGVGVSPANAGSQNFGNQYGYGKITHVRNSSGVLVYDVLTVYDLVKDSYAFCFQVQQGVFDNTWSEVCTNSTAGPKSSNVNPPAYAFRLCRALGTVRYCSARQVVPYFY